jgi:hypothetical protein
VDRAGSGVGATGRLLGSLIVTMTAPGSGSTALGFEAGQRATLTFMGTGVSWIGFRGSQVGIADVYLDGVKVVGTGRKG